MKNELYRLCESELDEILKILVIKHPKTHDELEDYSIIVKEIVETYEAKRKNLMNRLSYYSPELKSYAILAECDERDVGTYEILDLEEEFNDMERDYGT